MTRAQMLHRLQTHAAPWDIIVIGGGATGVGVAIDAAARGYDALLLEGSDFGKGTSSRSTKLVHGGVRYLEQGNISLVMEALKERGILRQNAPHLVSNLAFIVPNYDWWETPFYGLGLKVYNVLSGKYGFRRRSSPGRTRSSACRRSIGRVCGVAWCTMMVSSMTPACSSTWWQPRPSKAPPSSTTAMSPA